MLQLPNHLIPSARNQSVGTKPGVRPRECRQGGSAMNHREEARPHGPAGCRFGRSGGRASCANAKSILSAPFQKGPAVAKAVTDSQPASVLRAVMPGIQCVHITGEVSQRPGLKTRVTASYKSATKGKPHALAAGTASHRPCPQRGQQRQSNPATRDERQNHARFPPTGQRGLGSPGARNPHAGKYEESTSSRQRGGGGGNATSLPTEVLWPGSATPALEFGHFPTGICSKRSD